MENPDRRPVYELARPPNVHHQVAPQGYKAEEIEGHNARRNDGWYIANAPDSPVTAPQQHFDSTPAENSPAYRATLESVTAFTLAEASKALSNLPSPPPSTGEAEEDSSEWSVESGQSIFYVHDDDGFVSDGEGDLGYVKPMSPCTFAVLAKGARRWDADHPDRPKVEVCFCLARRQQRHGWSPRTDTGAEHGQNPPSQRHSPGEGEA